MGKSARDGFLPLDSVARDVDEIPVGSRRLVDACRGPQPGAMVRVALAPCCPFAVGEGLMVESAEMAERNSVRLRTHLAEDKDEEVFCRGMFGRSLVEQFEHVGWAGPNSWVAHLAYPSDDEPRRMAAAGVGVAYCPSSTMLICGAAAPAPALRSCGLRVGVGCGGSASGDRASLRMQARNALLLARFQHGPTSMPARGVLDAATVGSVRCVGWDDEIGCLIVGSVAGLVVWGMIAVCGCGRRRRRVRGVAALRPGRRVAWRGARWFKGRERGGGGPPRSSRRR
jgi:cytosine/adenosine deaminase-related metal-dependent hydrolase